MESSRVKGSVGTVVVTWAPATRSSPKLDQVFSELLCFTCNGKKSPVTSVSLFSKLLVA